AGGLVTFRGARITALAGTPGGTNPAIYALDQSDSASSGLVFTYGATGAPTRAAVDLLAVAAAGGASDAFVWDASVSGKPIVLRASQAEGFEIRTTIPTTLTTAMQVAVTVIWIEI